MGTLVARWERGVATGFLWAALSVAGCDGGTTAAPQPDASAVDAPDVGCASGERLCGARCVDPTSDPSNCGACGQVCSLTHVAAHACAASACAVVRCADGYGDCDGTAANGCETDLRVTASSCGACGRGCALPDATAACAGGACAVTTCATGFADCDMNPANGCEVDTRSDLASCGACGQACSVAHGTAGCAAGACAVASCATGYGDCNGAASDGCETDLRSATVHCGACGRACAAGAACTAGACVCPAGQRAVGTACVAADAAPRPIAPLSLGDVTQRRPTLRWALATGFDGAVVELCRDRACTAVIETLTATGSRARPTAELPARSVVFWRLRGRVGATTDTAYGPTWLFHVPATSASSEVDTSANPHLDVNGDGYDDVVASSLGASPGGRANAGAVRVFLGSATGVSATSVRVLEGAAEGDQFGHSVASAGDVNGDGYADLVVGASEADPGGRATAGTASVFLGSAMGVGASAARVLEGGAANDYFGWSVAGAGDLNGDGYADLVVGAPAADPGGRSGAGTASVFLGSAMGIGATADRVLEGGARGDRFGLSAASAGDVNGDGYTDLVVGASGAAPGGRILAGTVSVFHGSASGVGTTAARVLEGAADDQFGVTVASAGDVNGDGCSDLVVGSPYVRIAGRPAVGRASVFMGSVTGIEVSAARVFEGDVDLSNLGFSVASAGDVNGDGYADVVVGAFQAAPGGRTQAGTASVFHGSATGVGATAARVLEGAAAGDLFGHSVAGAGDVNADGYADVVVGASNAQRGGRLSTGAVSVFQGTASGVGATPAWALEGGAAFETLGWSVASADDLPRPGSPRPVHLPPPWMHSTPALPRRVA